ncbi:MAG: tetratricopeptide repeat protein, partial [Deltaproteobacteria bacterium]|nr:tetratricopeptide repeat protein [Deltaproteobacteria bacterium]
KPVHQDTSPKFPARLLTLIGNDAAVISTDRELFIYLPGADKDEALDWANSFRKKVTKLGSGTYSQGISVYPCPGFKKADVPLNARKATIHASFSGPAAITPFDAVSLNISGDIYYNEGDLNGAIREYRLGLNLDPDNINLLNSLGVIYAQIERYKMAMPLFERILSITSGDFMAMYNLGFAYLRGGSREQALTYFEQALALDPDSFDLLLQLGQIYCADHQYKKAVKVLNKAEKAVSSPKAGNTSRPWERCEPWHESSDNLGHDLIYRYLGEAYKGINKNREAITYLQKATRYNSRDARALSLLGELYSIEKQGADIAVALCRQAVELDGGSAGHWRRLALTLLKNDDLDEALAAVKKSLGIAPKDPDALLSLARIYQKLGKLLPARTTLERLLKLDGTNKAAGKLLLQINRKKY